jgi:hypothetical protein
MTSISTDKSSIGTVCIICGLLFLAGVLVGVEYQDTEYYHISVDTQGTSLTLEMAYPDPIEVGVSFKYYFTINPYELGWHEWEEHRNSTLVVTDTVQYETGVVRIEMIPETFLLTVETIQANLVGDVDLVDKWSWTAVRLDANSFQFTTTIWFVEA